MTWRSRRAEEYRGPPVAPIRWPECTRRMIADEELLGRRAAWSMNVAPFEGWNGATRGWEPDPLDVAPAVLAVLNGAPCGQLMLL
jgi:hypothetical protein